MNAPLSQAAVLDHITIELGGATLTIPTRAVAKALLERMLAGAVQATVGVPNIGEQWQGGTYAGVIRGARDGDAGAPDQHLIMADVRADNIAWQDAMAWTKGIDVGGFRDWTLPTRKELALLFANIADRFEQEFYWSGEQHAENPDYAWGADFSNGYQDYFHKGFKGRARAVRRVPIQ